MNGKVENDILFSKSVKAGKRIYYIDVKRDRHDELYLSLTESKRVKEGTEELRPVFEKHKIFLYKEDFEKFTEGLHQAIQFISKEQGLSERRPDEKIKQEPAEEETESLSADEIKIDIDF